MRGASNTDYVRCLGLKPKAAAPFSRAGCISCPELNMMELVDLELVGVLQQCNKQLQCLGKGCPFSTSDKVWVPKHNRAAAMRIWNFIRQTGTGACTLVNMLQQDRLSVLQYVLSASISDALCCPKQWLPQSQQHQTRWVAYWVVPLEVCKPFKLQVSLAGLSWQSILCCTSTTHLEER